MTILIADDESVSRHMLRGLLMKWGYEVVAAEDGIYFLELNTLPGLTTASLLPQELRAAGIDFRDFLEEQIEIARQRLTV